MHTRTFRAMGCEVRVLAEGRGERLQSVLDGIPRWVEAHESALSRFRPQSQLSSLNASPGVAQPVAPALWSAIDDALRAAEWSGGLVTPTVGAAMRRAGYDRDFASLSALPEVAAQPPLPVPHWRLVGRDARAHTVRLPPGVELDLGGTAKGATADLLAQRLTSYGPCLVDVGGDLAVRGARASGEPWPVAVADPAQSEEPLEVLALAGGGVATSGRDFRRWKTTAGEAHHLIDPRTGAPSRTDVLTATVVAPTALAAEVAAKMVVLLGADAGIAWLDRHHLGGVAVLDGGERRASARFEEHRWG